MSDTQQGRWTQLYLMPLALVLLWSTGYVGAKYGLPHAEPMTFMAYRFVIAAGLLAGFSFIAGAPWPASWREAAHIAVAGLLLQAAQLGSVAAAIYYGLESGVAALIIGAQPLIVAALSVRILGDSLRWRHWMGFALGAAGVALVVWEKTNLGTATPLGLGLGFIALFGASFGLLYQKRFCSAMDLRSGNVIQLAAAATACTLLAWATETGAVEWNGEFVFALGWLVVAISFGAATLLFYLTRRGLASHVASLFYLVPPAAAMLGWLIFDETFGAISIIGIGVAVAGVALVRQ